MTAQRPGSVRLTVALTPEQAEQLKLAVRDGQLDDYDVMAVRITDSWQGSEDAPASEASISQAPNSSHAQKSVASRYHNDRHDELRTMGAAAIAAATYESEASSAYQARCGFSELISWLTTRLYHRGDEAAKESDHDERGIVTVLRWLAADEYAFEEKYRTFTVSSPESANLREYSILAEQLARLKYRCRSILTEGRDPGRDDPFTCAVPNGSSMLEAGPDGGTTQQTEELLQMFRAMLVDKNGVHVTADEMAGRFELAGGAMQEVARWIVRGEFDVTRQYPVTD